MSGGVWSRRAFLCSTPLLLHAQAPETWLKYKDGATEFEVLRITSPRYASFLPPAHLRPVNGKNNLLLYCSEETGQLQVCRADLKTAETVTLTTAENLDNTTVSFLPGDKTFCYFDGNRLMVANAAGNRHGGSRPAYEVPEGWQRVPGFGISIDGNHAAFVEKNQKSYRIRLASLLRAGATTVLESDSELSGVLPRPRRAAILYRKNGAVWQVNYDGQQNRPLRIAQGKVGPALWAPDGRTFAYLAFPEDRAKLNQLREATPDSNEDKLIAPTSQFVNFARNTDGSVFAGASSNKASAYILLLLRVARRELTLCEHRASKPADVTIVFSPNSQRLFFESDKDGKQAIYTIRVDKFVEETETSSGSLLNPTRA